MSITAHKWDGLWCVAVGCALLAASSVAATESRRTVVVGEASFEARSTLVPMMICEEGEECPKSVPYWALVIEKDGVLYELDRAFHRGSRFMPDAIELDEVVIRPGTRISLDAQVKRVTDSYAVMRDVANVTVEMDVATAPSSSLIWRCASVSRGMEGFQVEISNTGLLRNVSSYEIQISTTSEHGRRRIAQVRNVDVEVTPEEAFFYGTDGASEVELTLDLTENVFSKVPARFRYAGMRKGSTWRVPVELMDEIVCDGNPIH